MGADKTVFGDVRLSGSRYTFFLQLNLIATYIIAMEVVHVPMSLGLELQNVVKEQRAETVEKMFAFISQSALIEAGKANSSCKILFSSPGADTGHYKYVFRGSWGITEPYWELLKKKAQSEGLKISHKSFRSSGVYRPRSVPKREYLGEIVYVSWGRSCCAIV
jgi:hypothetical protein